MLGRLARSFVRIFTALYIIAHLAYSVGAIYQLGTRFGWHLGMISYVDYSFLSLGLIACATAISRPRLSNQILLAMFWKCFTICYLVWAAVNTKWDVFFADPDFFMTHGVYILVWIHAPPLFASIYLGWFRSSAMQLHAKY